MHQLPSGSGSARRRSCEALGGVQTRSPGIQSTYPAMEGLQELLDHAIDAGIKVVVVSSGQSEPIVRWLEARALDRYVMHVVGADSVQTGKPGAAPYQRAVELLALRPSECLAVEDSESGVMSAHAAYVFTVKIGRESATEVALVADLHEVVQELLSRHAR